MLMRSKHVVFVSFSVESWLLRDVFDAECCSNLLVCCQVKLFLFLNRERHFLHSLVLCSILVQFSNFALSSLSHHALCFSNIKYFGLVWPFLTSKHYKIKQNPQHVVINKIKQPPSQQIINELTNDLGLYSKLVPFPVSWLGNYINSNQTLLA